MSHECSVCFTCDNCIHGNLPGLWGLVQQCGKATLTSFDMKDKTLASTVYPSELQSPPGSTLLWSITQIEVL